MTIEVLTYDDRGARTTRDRAEATTPENAVVAARTLLEEARDHCVRPRAAVYVNGKLVRDGITLQELWHA